MKGVHFDGIYIAEDIGSYKPELNNFKYLVEHIQSDFGIPKEGICHTAQSLTFDHVPAKTMGFRPSVFISRGGGNMGMGDIQLVKDKVNIGTTFGTLSEMAAAVEKAFSSKEQSQSQRMRA